MHGGQHQMSRFGAIQREAHGLRLAHFADHEDVWILAQRIQQTLFETRGVTPDLALANVSGTSTKRVFNGTFERDDVAGLSGIDLFDQGSQRGGFSGTSRATLLNEIV